MKQYLTDKQEQEYLKSDEFKQDIQKIINKNKLANECMAHRYLYYVLCEPIITDMEYDILEKKALLTCDETHPLRKPGSDLRSSYNKEFIEQANELLNII